MKPMINYSLYTNWPMINYFYQLLSVFQTYSLNLHIL